VFIIARSRICVAFLKNLIFFFYCDDVLAPCPTPKLEDHPLSAVRDCLFNMFPATLHIWRPSPPSATCHGAVTNLRRNCNVKPVPVAAQSKARKVFDRPNTGITGSNPTRGLNVFLRFSMLCCPV
jgi:hypothetical protein